MTVSIKRTILHWRIEGQASYLALRRHNASDQRPRNSGRKPAVKRSAASDSSSKPLRGSKLLALK